MEIAGKVIIITGASSGIGRTLAVECAKKKAKVVVTGRRANKLKETLTEIENENGEGAAYLADVTNQDQVKQMVDDVISQFGHIDILYNNAGSFNAIGPLWEVDPEEWWHDIDVNLRGIMLCSSAALPHMIEKNSGIIINASGGGAGFPNPGGSGYSCSKAAILRVTDTLAEELKKINANVITFALDPDTVRTAMTENLVKSPVAKKWLSGLIDRFNNNDLKPPEVCAQTALSLIEVASQQLSGRTFMAGMDIESIVNEIYSNPHSKKGFLRIN